ncbi:hypothetical protein RB195_004707 [Necator americanus]|uniref:Uncharacterized protein n=1 Tax=Necator americanus TaxID=51031 RepID=A0ABR1BMT5_NECAM
MAERRGRSSKLPPHPDSQSERPTWTVTRRERTELSPLRSTSPFQSRTVTTTERVQILQMPITLTEEQIAPARFLALSPHGNTSQSVSSTVTTMQAQGAPLVSGITANGVPLFNGILLCPEERHTTTIITTTTTTYRMIEVSDSDSLSDDFEVVDDSALTVDVSLVPSRTTSPQYMIVGKTESEPPLSPVAKSRVNIDLELVPKEISRATELEEKPIMEMVNVYHSGISGQYGDGSDAPDVLAERSSELYGSDQIPSTSDSEITVNVPSSGDLKTISTSSEDEDIVIVGADMVELITSGSSINEERRGSGENRASRMEYFDLQKSPLSEGQQEDFEHVEKPSKYHGFPSTAAYKGPLDSTSPVKDLEDEPITHHVSVYHNGRSDEPFTSKEKTSDSTANIARMLGDKIMSLFAKQNIIPEYPTSEPYEGPLEDTKKREDIESQPLHTIVTVYHSGRSDVPQEPITRAVPVETVPTKDMYYDYPTTEVYEGPLDSTTRVTDIEGEPLTYHVSVYHSGRSDEPAPKPEEEQPLDIAEAAKTLGEKITGLFKRGPAHLDYPVSEIYEGPLDSTNRTTDIEGEPLTHHVSVYHSGRSDEPAPKPEEEQPLDIAEAAKTLGPLDSTNRTTDIEGEPLTHHVSVYHSGRSDEPAPKPEEEQPLDIAEAAKTLGEKITGLFKRGPAHLDYPVSEIYEGPLDSTNRTTDIEGEPLTHHVSVYHSGRSDEPAPKPEEEQPLDIAEAAKTFGDKITGLFKRRPTIPDYPTSEPYEGPLEDTKKREDIESQPLHTIVTVYHSGRSDVPQEPITRAVPVETVPTKDMYYDYPTTEVYEGPLDSTTRVTDIEGEPLTYHVSVYHSGRSDEPAPKPEEEQPLDIAEAAKTLGEKITGLFKRGPAHLDYPVSEIYEGPLDSTNRTTDIEGEPLTHHVSVYHSGRSDEPAPKPEEEQPLDIAEAAKTFGDKITGLFKRRPTIPDYPTSEPYEGPLEDTKKREDIESQPLHTIVTVYHSGRSDVPQEPITRAVPVETVPTKDMYYDYPTTEVYEGPLDSTTRVTDIEGEPLTYHVSVYHSGRSDEPAPKPEEEQPLDIAEAAKTLGEKITGLFKRGPAHLDYPVSEIYEGPLDSTNRTTDIEGEPLTHHVSVYHSGRSDEPAPKPEEEQPLDIAEAAKTFGDKITGLFKRRPTIPDYPTSEPYEGPLEDTKKREDIESQPLHTIVTVYHSGRSDVPQEPITRAVPVETVPTKDMYYDYPTTEVYEGPLDSTTRVTDIEGEPLTYHVSVYHSGRSDEPAPKPEEEQPLDIAEAAKTLGEKITGLFKRGPAHLDYPVSEIYEGPLDSTNRTTDIEGEPLTHHVSVYHSGRSDEPAPKPDEERRSILLKQRNLGKITADREPETEEEQPLDIAEAAKTLGLERQRSLACSREALLTLTTQYQRSMKDHSDSTNRTTDIEGEPLTHHVSVYHSGRSDEPAPKPEEEQPLDIAEAAKTFGDKITGLFKRRPTIPDYPTSEPYEGPLEDTKKREDIESQPLHTIVTVYHSGRSDVPQEPITRAVPVETVPTKDMYYDYPTTEVYEGPLDSTTRVTDIEGEPLTYHVSVYHSGRSDEPAPKPEEEQPLDIAEAAKTLGEKITGLFKRGPAHLDYPVSEIYEGPLDSTNRTTDIEGEPLTHHVSVYHSGRSDEPAPKPEEEQPLDIAEAAKTLGEKITGLFKRGPAHLDYPVSEIYEGPLDSTNRTTDIEGEPLTHHSLHVSVYHSGRSDEPAPKPEEEQPLDIAEAAKTFGDKITGLFKRRPTIPDYPTSEPYEGPLEDTKKREDIESQPLHTIVTVYHSGRSDVPQEPITRAVPVETVPTKDMYYDYPTTEVYEGPLDSTTRVTDIEGEPLTYHVSVYHSGRSDEPAPKPEEEQPLDIAEAAKTLGEKITGLFKRGPAHLDYPVSEIYEGPLDSTNRTTDIEGEPLTHHVSVYHSGRSDEPAPKPEEEQPLDIAEAAKTLGEPLTHHVSVYHSGRSDEPAPKPEEEQPLDIAEAAKTFGDKITGLFKRGPAHLDYPVSEIYEGPLDSTNRTTDIEGEPLTHHVSVYHSGRSDEPAPKPEEEQPLDIAEAAKTFGDKITGLFKRRPTIPDYPTSEPYEGPLEDTKKREDIESQPLHTIVTVYHSGRSDVPQEPITRAVPVETVPTKDMYYDYPTTEVYEGPLDSTTRVTDIEGEPLTYHVSVYHSGRSDEPAPKPEEEQPLDIAEAAKTLGEKITGLFKRGPAHLDYPVSEIYEGPLDSTNRTTDIEGEPLTHHVSVYHSGRSDEPAPKPEEEQPLDIAEAAKTFGDKITGLFKRRPTIPDYPTSEPYEGPLEDTKKREDIESQPLHTIVTVYHSGRSDVPQEPITRAVPVETVPTKDMYYDYPTTEVYEGPLDSTTRVTDIEGEPLTYHVSVYHSGRSDEPAPKPEEEQPLDIAEAAKTFGDKITGLFKRRPNIPDYPMSETLRRSTRGHEPKPEDIEGHSTITLPRSLRAAGKTEEEQPLDIAEAAKTLGEKITGLFKRGPAHLDYPVSEIYEGPLDSTNRTTDIEAPKPEEEQPLDIAEAAKTLGEKITGLFKRGPAHLDYPVSEIYEGPLDSTNRTTDIEGEPLTHHVSVYHSGRSDEPAPKPEEEQPLDIAEAAKTFGDKITGLFKRRPTIPDYPTSEPYEGPLEDTKKREDIESQPLHTIVTVYHSGRSDVPQEPITRAVPVETVPTKDMYYDYPTTEVYEGPLDSTTRVTDIEGEPLTYHVSVYHSGRSDEPAPKPEEEQPLDIAEAAKTLGEKITGLFKRGPAHLDYPVSEIYEGPLDSTNRTTDIEGEPLTHHVSVYHSGRSDEPAPKPEEEQPLDIAEATRPLIYEGPLDSTNRTTDIEGEPLTHHVSVYHSGRSDEPAPKPEEEQPLDIAEAAKTFGDKITGLFKRRPTIPDYPTSEPYEGPLEDTKKREDIESQPLHTIVTVYHSGRSDVPQEPITRAVPVETVPTKDMYYDYPTTEVYEGPLDSTTRVTDIEGEPLTYHVSVYHSGRSDEPAPKPEEEQPLDIAEAAKTLARRYEEQPLDIAEAAKTLGEKITGLFKRGPAHLDYPVSEIYEGPLDSTNRTTDIEGEPLTHHVSVYHSGRSDEPAPKPEEEQPLDIAEAAKTFGDKITGLFKRRPTIPDYPTSEPYEGPLEDTKKREDIESQPLHTIVTVYHSGRSDVPQEPITRAVPVETVPTKDMYYDYPTTEVYEGPLDSTTRVTDIEGEPLTYHVSVYHSGRSDEPAPKPEEEQPLDIAEAAKTLGEKITGLFKRGLAHLDYPVSEIYEGPLDSTNRTTDIEGDHSTPCQFLDSTNRTTDIEGEPLTYHVSVYHSGRSDEPAPKPEEEQPLDIAEAAKTFGDKITGLFKRRPTIPDYPTSEPYEGPLEDTKKREDIESQPLHTIVTVYHSGRSDVPQEPITRAVPVETVPTKDMYYDYPTTEVYEGPLDSTTRVTDIEGEPLTYHVSVYHSGRSDEPAPKPEEEQPLDIAEAAKTLGEKITGLFKRGPAHLDYPVSEIYEGPLDSTNRTTDIEGEPLTHHVSVYHSGRSDEPAPKPEEEQPLDIAEAAKTLEQPLDIAEAAKTLGEKITGLFKRGPAHLDYPVSEIYEGPLDSTNRTTDIEGEPLTHHVSVYHSGRSDEPAPKPEEEQPLDIAEAAKTFGDKITGLFKRRPTIPDYPTSEPYEGPLEDTKKREDIESQPLHTIVTVYHSGRSDVPQEPITRAVPVETVPTKDMYYDYPTTEVYEGPLDSTTRVTDIEGEPLTYHVSVYHSGRSDEPAPKPEEEQPLDIAEAAKTFGDKITGLFKRRPTIPDYPTSEPYEGPLEDTKKREDIESQPLHTIVTVYHSGRSDVPQEPITRAVPVETVPTKDMYYDYPTTEVYEGPLDSTTRVTDIEGEPLTYHVSVYHSGRSDEPAPKPEEEQPLDIAEAAKTFGDKITGLFKRRPNSLDYPTSEPYEGPLEDTKKREDIESQPLHTIVTVYHSGRSDVPQEPITRAVPVETVPTKDMYYDYPTTEVYEGPLDSTTRVTDIEGEPLTYHVSVYHSGRSDEPAPKPEEEQPLDIAEAAKTLGEKITGLFKRGPAHLDYPVSEIYEGPLDSTNRTTDIEGEPLTHHVSVYHSGRSDEPAPKPEEEQPLDIAEAAKTFGDKITGLFKRRPTIPDYPTSEPYEGPLEDTKKREDIESQPLHTIVTVYHSGRSDVPQEPITRAVPVETVPTKDMYYDYPTTEVYEGPLDSTTRVTDIEGEPLTYHVSVYHSGRSDEPAPKPEEEQPLDIAEAAKTLGEKITGLFKRGPAHLDYPVSEIYEGPLDSTNRTTDIEAPKPEEEQPLDIAEAAKTFGDKITGLFKRRPTIPDYPTSEPYEGPLEDTKKREDIESQPLHTIVTVYHSGRSDVPQEPITRAVPVETVPTKDMYYDYPTTEVYEGPLDSTTRVTDVEVEEPLDTRSQEQPLDIAEAAKTLGEKITGLFKRGPAHLDYPVSEIYEGPLDSTNRTTDIEGEPLTHHVSVYHSGRSDEPAPKPEEEQPLDIAEAAKTFGDKITGLFKRRPTIPDYPTSEPYEGPLEDTKKREDIESQPLHTIVTVYHSGRSDVPQEPITRAVPVETVPTKDMYYDYPTTEVYEGPLDSTTRVTDIEGEPLTYHVSVYHSGRSDEPAPKPEEEQPLDIAEAAKTLGEKITGLFKRGPAHLDYPVSEIYEGPLDSTNRTTDIEGEPLTHHVSVYHSGRSDEPAPKPEEEQPLDIAEAAKTFGDKITGLFKRRPTIPDYPTSEPYEGPLEDTKKREDIESQPLHTIVTVYHSGRSDVPQEPITRAVPVETVPTKDMYYDYPTTEVYEGPLDSTTRVTDIEGEPLTYHVSVYHSGRSDEPAPKPEEEQPLDIAEAAKTLGEKITGLFKRGPAHLDYPVSEIYEGPLDSTNRTTDIEGEPLTYHVSVYHSGRSDEPAPKPEEEQPLDIAEAAKTFGDKITGLFKRRPTIPDYPTSEPYEGPLEDTKKREDIESQPLHTIVTVYHSGRSDVPQEPITRAVPVETVPTKDMYYDYPTTEVYEGPLDSTTRVTDIEGEPLTYHVSVYHSGRSDEPAPKPEEEQPLDIAEAAKTLGEKITGLFKRGPAHLDYPVSEIYEGPLDSTNRTTDIEDYPTSEPYEGPLEDTKKREDIESQPLHTIVTVYHSGRSDVPQEPITRAVPVETVPTKDMYYDYPTTEVYEGPLDSTTRVTDIEGEPLTYHVSVYHSGRSDEPAPKPEEEQPLDIAEAAKTLGEKITGLFKRGPAHLDYPVSEIYEGPLDSTNRTTDIEGEPLTHHVSVYHSGRSDEPAPKPEEEQPLDIAEAAKTFGDKITGLFKRRPTIPDYPTSEPYEGPLEDTKKREDIESQPLHTIVTVYHSGRSDVPQEPITRAVPVETVPTKDMYYDYPTTEVYEGPLDSTTRVTDIEGEPLTYHVSVYHSGRSDEPAPKPEEEQPLDIAEAAKTLGEKITGLFKRGPAHLDYPVSEIYEGPLDSTNRTTDIEGEPLTHHVSVYHSGRSDEPAPKPEEEQPLDIAEAAKTFGDKITGLFKRRPTIPDYPTSEPYEGPLEDTKKREDIESQPLHTIVTVYHSGRSDVPQEPITRAVPVETVPTKDMYYDYPTTEVYEGPLDSTTRVTDIEGEPLTYHVSVYHSGRSDEPAPKPEEEQPLDIAEAAKTLGEKITGLFKKCYYFVLGPPLEGPLDSTNRTTDIEGEPLTHHVSVYHSGRSDEPAPKPEEEQPLDIAEAAKTFGDKITGLFKRRPTIPDYPTSEPYEGPLEDTKKREDIESQPLHTIVTVYHSGRSDVPQEPITRAVPVETVPTKDMYYDYPTTEVYEGPLDSTTRVTDIEGEPLTYHVSVYHSGRSDEPAPKPEEEQPLDIAEAAKTLGEKITGLFKRGPAHLDYPVSEIYEGPLDSTNRTTDIEGEPLTHHVSVYHSGRSDEPAPKPEEEQPLDIAEAAKTFGDKITGLFKRRPTIPDYPTSEPYEGPLEDTKKREDIESQPLHTIVTVYHSGRSDVPQEPITRAVPVETVPTKDMYYDYPTTEVYEGPLDSTTRVTDIEGEPLTYHVGSLNKKSATRQHEPHTDIEGDPHVSVYHSGRSDEPAPKPEEEQPLDIAEAAKTLGEKITGLFKRGPAHLDYPVSEIYEGPLDSTNRTTDIEGEPLTHHVSVYHSGRSDEPAPKPEEEQPLDIAEAAKTFGDKITGLFKRRPTIPDYPTSEPYEGPLEDTKKREDIESQPLHTIVTVYHSGRSDVPQEPITRAVPVETVPTKDMYYDYPTTEVYEGPLDSTTRVTDIEGEPLTYHVSVYHSGRSDEPAPKPEEEQPLDIAEAAKTLGEKITGLFKRGPAHLDYPVSEIYEGPLDSTNRTTDIEGEPLTHHVSVYHSGRSDEPAPKPEEEQPLDIAEAAKTFGDKITGLFKRRPTIPDYPTGRPTIPDCSTSRTLRRSRTRKREDINQPQWVVSSDQSRAVPVETVPTKDMYYDYPTTEVYEGPLDSTTRVTDIEGEPLTYHVSVYHSGRSDEPAPKPEEEQPLDIAEAAKTLGEKITGLFKRGPAHLDYPVSEIYEGPLDSTNRTTDIEGEPLTHHVSVYHSGRSDEPAPKPEEEQPLDIAEAAKTFGDKITGLFKRRPTIPDYPTSEPYEGPLEDTKKREDIESQPLHTIVTVYHSGRSDVPQEPITRAVPVETVPTKDMYYDYPTTEVYEGPLDSTTRVTDIEGEPLTYHVSVYHSGRSDEPAPKPEEEQPLDIAEAAKTLGEKITGLFKRGPAHLDYPVSEIYEGPLDSTNRTTDIEGEPKHHVSVYHSGRSDEPAPKPEEEQPLDIAEAAKTFGDKITGLFKRRPTIPDYPTSEPYEGPLEDTKKREDIESQPLHTIVTVYHSGRSDVPQEPITRAVPVETVPTKDMYYDYPTTEVYEGPLDSTTRVTDIEGEPLTYHVSVYHSGRSDEPAPKPEEEQPLDIAEAAKTLGEKITGLFKRGPAHLDYPVSEIYEGPLDSTNRTSDLEEKPLTHHVSVYHSGRSDEFITRSNGKVDHHLFLEETATQVKKSPRSGYPASGVYDGPLETTYFSSDIDEEPVTHHVSVFHRDDSWDKYRPCAEIIRMQPDRVERLDLDKDQKKVDLDIHFNIKPQEIYEMQKRQYEETKSSLEEPPVFLSADNLERDQKPVGFSVSISARQPEDRTGSELFSSVSRESSSDKKYLRGQSTRNERSQKHRLSPHTWTTVKERTEVTYVRKLRVERSLSPRHSSPPRSSFIKRVPYSPSVVATADRAYTCRSKNFDERVMVHHPIYPPHQSLYRNGTYGNGDSRNGRASAYSPVREVAAFDRTEWIDQRPSYIPPNRRADEIFTVGTPFIMGHVERDDNGCAYLRYQSSGLQERPPLPERLDDLPMIEEGAIECRRATIRAGLRDMDTVGLVQDEEELERRRRPIRRARQRMRSYCTML